MYEALRLELNPEFAEKKKASRKAYEAVTRYLTLTLTLTLTVRI